MIAFLSHPHRHHYYLSDIKILFAERLRSNGLSCKTFVYQGSGSSAGLERMPVTHEVAGSSPVRSAILQILIADVDSYVSFIDERLQESKKRVEGGQYDFDCVPHHGLPSVTSLLKSYDSFMSFCLHYFRWYKLYGSHHRHELYQLMKPIKTLRDGNKQLYINQAVKALVYENRLEDAILLAEHLPFDSENRPALLELCRKGLLRGLRDKISRLLHHFTIPMEGWRSGIGEAPPALLALIEEFKELIKSESDSELVSIGEECIKEIECRIEEGIVSDSDDFDL